MKRIRSLGVEVPDAGDELLEFDDARGGGARVVLRVRWVVSSDGGGGREARVEARQRKHSPFPK